MPTSCSSWSQHRAASAGRPCTSQSTASPPSLLPLFSRCCCWMFSCMPASLGTLTRYSAVVGGIRCTLACEQATGLYTYTAEVSSVAPCMLPEAYHALKVACLLRAQRHSLCMFSVAKPSLLVRPGGPCLSKWDTHVSISAVLPQVLPSDVGQRQPFYFFLQPSYWRPNQLGKEAHAGEDPESPLMSSSGMSSCLA